MQKLRSPHTTSKEGGVSVFRGEALAADDLPRSIIRRDRGSHELCDRRDRAGSREGSRASASKERESQKGPNAEQSVVASVGLKKAQGT